MPESLILFTRITTLNKFRGNFLKLNYIIRGRERSFHLALWAVLFYAANLSAQAGLENIRASFHSRYGEGDQTTALPGAGGEIRKHYLENRLDLEYSRGLIEAGLSLESREPAEFGENFSRLRKAFVQYADNRYIFRLGTLYSLSGQGLTFNLLEDRKLDFDNTIRGFQGVVQLEKLRFQALAGTGNYTDYNSPLVIDSHVLAAFNLEYEPAKGFSLGINTLHDRLTKRKDHKSANHLEMDAKIPSWIWGPFMGITADQWEFFIEFSGKHTGRNRLPLPGDIYQLPIRLLGLEKDVSGKGLYWNLAYSQKGYGVSLEYKNYQYNLAGTSASHSTSGPDPAAALPYQNPPTVIKEHLYILLSRFPILSNTNNEIGFELEFNARPSRTLAFQAVASATSKADIFLPAAGAEKPGRDRGGFPLLPRFRTSYNPIYDSFLELRWRKLKNLQIFSGAGFRSITEYNLQGKFGKRTRLWTLPAKIQFRWSPRFTTLLDLETQHVLEKYFPAGPKEKSYFNNYLALTLSWAPIASVTLSREFTSADNNSAGTRNNWNLISTSFRLRKWGDISLSYGQQREGMLCSNGLCRYVPGFKGLRAEMSIFY